PLSLKPFEYVPTFLKSAMKVMSGILPEGAKGKSFLERGCTPIQERYYGNAKIFTELEKQQLLAAYRGDIHYTQVTRELYEEMKLYDDVTKMQYIDMYTWLRGDILLKADKMTMANSLELRVPFLDMEVFRVAYRIQPNFKITDGTTKAILSEAAKGIVPEHVLNRRKLGFPVPIRRWLKDEMYEWAVEIIRASATEHLIPKRYVL